MCFNGALCSIPFNLVCNMSSLLLVKCFDFTSGVECLCKDRICDDMVLYAPFSLICYAT